MDDAVAAAYAASPVWLQHLFVSAYGVRLRFLRYGRRQRRYLAELRRTQWLSAAELRALQLQRLAALVRHARETVGLYRGDRKSTRLNSSHLVISYAVFCLKKKKRTST